jgi:hypothetical protein
MMEFWIDADFPGADLQNMIVESHEMCMDSCLARAECVAYTFDPRPDPHNCWLKSKPGSSYNMNYVGLISGMRCGLKPDLEPPTIPDGKYPENYGK